MMLHCDLTKLAEVTPTFSKATCDSYVEAAAVALAQTPRPLPVQLVVKSVIGGVADSGTFALVLPIVSNEMNNAWADISEAVEHGAYAFALLLAPQITGHSVLQRSSKGTGFDYWLGDASPLPFDKKARLEVSGIGSGTDTDVQRRIAQKKTQTHQSRSSGLKGFVAVTEFSVPQTHIQEA